MTIKLHNYTIEIDQEDLTLFQSCHFNFIKYKNRIKLKCTKHKIYFEALIFKKYGLNFKAAVFLDNNYLNFKKDNLKVFRHIKRNKYNIPYLGVHFDPRHQVYTCYLDREYNGTYYTAEEAALAYNELAIKTFGQFALLNKVDLENKTIARDVRLRKKIINHGNYSEVFCKRAGKIDSFLIDNDKLWIIEKYACSIRNSHGTPYVVLYNLETKKKQYLHSFLTDCPKNLQVDHINRNSLDNRLNNLRVVTALINMQNVTRKPGKSGHVGIHLLERRDGIRYKVRFMFNKINYDFGIYDSLDEALKVYNAKNQEIKKLYE